MTTFDDRLRAGLSADDEAFLTSLEDEPGLFAQMGATFAGSMKVWTGFAFILALVFFGLALWAGWQAYAAAELQHSIMWIGMAMAAWIALGLIKIWFWMRMNHLVTLREIKRLQLFLAGMKAN